jgi:Domain of unknown function (DUF6382)/FHA domain
MTNFTIEKLGLSSFLIYQLQKGEELDPEQLGLHAPGLLPCTAFEKEGSVFLRYDLIFETSFEKLTSAPMTKERLSGLLQSICETFTAAEESGLSPRKFVLDFNHIYHDNFSNRLVFIYLPLKSNVFEKLSLKEFFRGLLGKVQYGEKEDPHFFIKIHNYLASCSEVNLEFLAKIAVGVDGIENEDEAFYRPGSKAKTSVADGMFTSQYSSSKKDKKTGQKLEIEEEVQYKRITRTELGDHDSLLNRAAAFGGGTSINIMPKVPVDPEEEGTTVLGTLVRGDDEEGTTALGISSGLSRKPYLVVASSHVKVTITNDFFRIGRDPAQTDYTSKNTVVGRVHAHIISANGEYFLEDNQSRNGSYLNGIKLSPLSRVKIRHEDKIRLANEEYEFRLF